MIEKYVTMSQFEGHQWFFLFVSGTFWTFYLRTLLNFLFDENIFIESHNNLTNERKDSQNSQYMVKWLQIIFRRFVVKKDEKNVFLVYHTYLKQVHDRIVTLLFLFHFKREILQRWNGNSLEKQKQNRNVCIEETTIKNYYRNNKKNCTNWKYQTKCRQVRPVQNLIVHTVHTSNSCF